jgi:hypothetical protein
MLSHDYLMLRQSLVLETWAVNMSNSYAKPLHGLAICSKLNTRMPSSEIICLKHLLLLQKQKATKVFNT